MTDEFAELRDKARVEVAMANGCLVPESSGGIRKSATMEAIGHLREAIRALNKLTDLMERDS